MRSFTATFFLVALAENLLVPDFYIYQVQLDADEGREERNGLISVVY